MPSLLLYTRCADAAALVHSQASTRATRRCGMACRWPHMAPRARANAACAHVPAALLINSISQTHCPVCKCARSDGSEFELYGVASSRNVSATPNVRRKNAAILGTFQNVLYRSP